MAFMQAVPKKLEGKVNIGLACEVVKFYFELERSSAVSALSVHNYVSHFWTQAEGPLQLFPADDFTVLPEYTLGLFNKTTKITWNQRASEHGHRTARMLDYNVSESLRRQWSSQQAQSRVDSSTTIIRPAEPTMDWSGRLRPGLNGVRLLVITLLCWGYNIHGTTEVELWEALARDMVAVLHILCEQAGEFVPPAGAGNKPVRERSAGCLLETVLF